MSERKYSEVGPGMNQCQFCGADANVHLTDIVNQKKREMHLCEECARKHHLLLATPSPQLNLQALLELMHGSSSGPPIPETVALICPACGLQYAQFRTDGRLGCPEEYEAFKDALLPLLLRVHRSQTHEGKVPRTIRSVRQAARLENLRTQLADAVAMEDYESAARLRDELLRREKEVAE